MNNKRKGYRVERKIRKILESKGWLVVRAGGSLGDFDLVAFNHGKAIFIQVKSTKKDKLYYHGYMKDKLMGIPFFVFVDFNRKGIYVFKPKKVLHNGIRLEDFLNSFH